LGKGEGEERRCIKRGRDRWSGEREWEGGMGYNSV